MGRQVRRYPALASKDERSDSNVEFPDFPGCFTAGKTLEEATAFAHEALALHVHAMRADGEAVPDPSDAAALMTGGRPAGRALVLVELTPLQGGPVGSVADQDLDPAASAQERARQLDRLSPIRDNLNIEILYTAPFEKWLKRLRDRLAQGAIVARLKRIQNGNFGDHRSVGGGVSELRIDVGKGYRLYYTTRRQTVVILLCGGDKARQRQDIQRAQNMAREL